MKCYIDDFVEDLNYRQVILYIGNVDLDNLRSKNGIRQYGSHESFCNGYGESFNVC